MKFRMNEIFHDYEQEVYQKLLDFYSPYFPNTTLLNSFITKVFQLDWNERKPRQMVLQIQRFVTLAIDIDKLRPSRDGLRILFLKCGLESLMRLADYTGTKNFYCDFEKCFSDEGRKYILSHFKVSHIETSACKLSLHDSPDMILSDFLNVIKVTRDMVVHEGNYWEVQLFAQDDDSTWLTCIETDQRILANYQYPTPKKNVIHNFETTLQFDRFIHYFVEACVSFISSYMDKTEAYHARNN